MMQGDLLKPDNRPDLWPSARRQRFERALSDRAALAHLDGGKRVILRVFPNETAPPTVTIANRIVRVLPVENGVAFHFGSDIVLAAQITRAGRVLSQPPKIQRVIKNAFRNGGIKGVFRQWHTDCEFNRTDDLGHFQDFVDQYHAIHPEAAK